MPPAPTKPMIDEARMLYSNMKSAWLIRAFPDSGKTAQLMTCALPAPVLRTASSTSASTASNAS